MNPKDQSTETTDKQAQRQQVVAEMQAEERAKMRQRVVQPAILYGQADDMGTVATLAQALKQAYLTLGNEYAIKAELLQEVEALTAERDAIQAELDALKKGVEAAKMAKSVGQGKKAKE